MKSTRKRDVLFAWCLLVSCWSVPLASGFEAQASDPPQGRSAFALTISPTRFEVGRADAGRTQRVRVVNGGKAPLSVTVRKQDFTGAKDGTMAFHARARYSASHWVKVSPTHLVVAPGATRTVTASISMPTDAEPGDHQVALVFSVPAARAAPNIRINRGIAIPVYVTVPGPITGSLSLSDLRGPGFATGGNVKLSAELHNTGSVHRTLPGTTPLKVSGAGEGAAFAQFTIMRDSTRIVRTTWRPPLFCICHPRVSIVRPDGVVQSVSVRVIVVPLGLLGPVVCGLLVLLVATRLGRRRYRANVTRAAARLVHPAAS